MRSLLLVSDEKKILIDNGAGNKMGDKLNDIYGIDHTKYSLSNSLNNAGLKREDITDVILTHLHFDHCGGSTYIDERNELKLTFPNAVYHIQHKHWDWANNPTERDKASFFPDNFALIQKAGHLKLIEGDLTFDEQIKLHVTNGHTPSQQMVSISDKTTTLLYPADLLPLTTHVNIPYIMGYDLFPLKTLDEKKKYLPKIAEEKWYVFFEHDPYTEISKIHWNKKRFEIVDKSVLGVL
jgi:glyoxylase-like metal-dependent hydrolase (beta-lactamase superfamily II)